jgi:hypothetical protein
LISIALSGESAQVQSDTRAIGTLLQDVGAFFGIYAFTFMTARMGRRPAFALSFLLAFAVTIGVFNMLRILDAAASGIFDTGGIWRIRHLFSGALPDASSQYGHRLLL